MSRSEAGRARVRGHIRRSGQPVKYNSAVILGDVGGWLGVTLAVIGGIGTLVGIIGGTAAFMFALIDRREKRAAEAAKAAAAAAAKAAADERQAQREPDRRAADSAPRVQPFTTE